MKTRRIPPIFLASFAVAGLLASACAKDTAVQPQPASTAQSQAAAPAPAAGTDPALPAPAPSPAPAPVVASIPAAPVLIVNPDASNSWSSMKDLPFEQRAAFIAGLGRLEAIVDTEISGL